MNDSIAPDAEFSAIQTLYSALEPLDEDARERVLGYVAARLEITLNAKLKAATTSSFANEEEAEVAEEQKGAPKFASMAELFEATQPTSNADKALVAGYWLQVCQGADDFDGQSANKELKHLGHGMANITNAVEALKNQKPALALQLRKSGKSQQARKVYKVTVAGIKRIETMING
jgi:hypothetical protein